MKTFREKNITNMLNKLFPESNDDLKSVVKMVLMNEVDEAELDRIKAKKEEDLKYIYERFENDKCVTIEYKNGET
jgi:hypothetical protein